MSLILSQLGAPPPSSQSIIGYRLVTLTTSPESLRFSAYRDYHVRVVAGTAFIPFRQTLLVLAPETPFPLSGYQRFPYTQTAAPAVPPTIPWRLAGLAVSVDLVTPISRYGAVPYAVATQPIPFRYGQPSPFSLDALVLPQYGRLVQPAPLVASPVIPFRAGTVLALDPVALVVPQYGRLVAPSAPVAYPSIPFRYGQPSPLAPDALVLPQVLPFPYWTAPPLIVVASIYIPTFRPRRR